MNLIRQKIKKFHFPIDIMLMCAKWYLDGGLSLRRLESMMKDKGTNVDHATIHRWVIKLAPLVEKQVRKFKAPVCDSWRMDETYIKVNGGWCYLYRAVDKYGKTVDF